MDINIITKYINSGLSLLPTSENKSPAINSWRGVNIPADEFINTYGIGIKCGIESGGIECLDFDNHYGDALQVLTNYLIIPEVKELYDLYKFPIEITVNKGYHLIFRCLKNDGNKKLASRKNKNGIPEAIIETRGEGGYFCCDPTPGYKIIRNNILEITTITEFERAVLIDNAISLNEYYPVIKTTYEGNDRPGDIYNSNADSVNEMISILQGAGWKEISKGRWRRPGKKEGVSASLGYVAPNIFYVFTSNAFPFECMKGYTPFQVLALLKFNGNFSEAALSLPHPAKIIIEKRQYSDSEIEKILNRSVIDTGIVIERPPMILTIIENIATSTIYQRIFSLGNFSCVIGKAKSKKTFLMTLFSAVIIKGIDLSGRLIGDLPNNKKLILYFDTEQGSYDSYKTMKRIEKLADTKEKFKGLNLRQYTPIQRCEIIEYAFRCWGQDIGYCVIDGIADLANGINDEEEATRVTTMLLRLTKDYNCHITTVIHQNKNDNYATGHLGSAIMKKSEIVISVNRIKDDYTGCEVVCDFSRGIMFKSFVMRVNTEGLPEMSIEEKQQTKIFNPYETEKDEDIPF